MVEHSLKHVMYGAGVQLGTKFADNAVFNAYQKAGKGNPAPWWYTSFFGYPLDDVVLDLGLPAALGVVGIVTKKQNIKDMAIGAGLTGIATFLNVFMARTGQYPWLPFRAGVNGNGYAGPTNPQPSPFAPSVSPQAQLMVGSKAGINRDVYKPNVSAPACAGSNAANQQLFI